MGRYQTSWCVDSDDVVDETLESVGGIKAGFDVVEELLVSQSSSFLSFIVADVVDDAAVDLVSETARDDRKLESRLGCNLLALVLAGGRIAAVEEVVMGETDIDPPTVVEDAEAKEDDAGETPFTAAIAQEARKR